MNLIDTDLEARVRTSFERQQVMRLLNAQLQNILPGEVQIKFPYQLCLTQQNGYIHAGIITTILDSACGFAAFTMMPLNRSVLSIEFKVNLLSPAVGESFIGIGKVIKAGRTITVCSGELPSMESGNKKLVAIMQASMITVEKRND